MDTSKRTSMRTAMAAYVVLALLAAFTLSGKMRIAVWIFLGGIAVKTVLSSLRHS